MTNRIEENISRTAQRERYERVLAEFQNGQRHTATLNAQRNRTASELGALYGIGVVPYTPVASIQPTTAFAEMEATEVIEGDVPEPGVVYYEEQASIDGTLPRPRPPYTSSYWGFNTEEKEGLENPDKKFKEEDL